MSPAENSATEMELSSFLVKIPGAEWASGHERRISVLGWCVEEGRKFPSA